MRAVRVGAVLLLLAGACTGTEEPVAQAPATPEAVVEAPVGQGQRPPLRLRGRGIDIALDVWAGCWSSGAQSGCGSGRPPENPPHIGSPGELEVVFDTPGWRFRASAVPTRDTCGGRQQSVDLAPTGPTTHRLPPIGKADEYTITLHGRSTEAATNSGDVTATLRWRTTANGPTEPPSATLSLLAIQPDMKVSLGAELTAKALGVSTQSGDVRATAIVTAANGAALGLQFAPHPQLECVPDGSLFLRSDGEDGRRLTAVGPAPYRYDVSLVLRGVVYRGTGTWPQDEIDDCSPCTRLRFDPPLPAL